MPKSGQRSLREANIYIHTERWREKDARGCAQKERWGFRSMLRV